VVAPFCDPEKLCTLSDHVMRYDRSRNTSLHRQGDGTVSSPSNPRITTGDSHDIHDLYDLRDINDQLC
jgi:hypothetical protein